MKLAGLTLYLFLGLPWAWGNEQVVSQMYFTEFMGHMHKTPSIESSSLTVVPCGFKVKILKHENTPQGWFYSKVGEDVGFIEGQLLSSSAPSCFQSKYRGFYNSLDLDLTELYHLGRLNERMIQVETKAK